jgi:hypothetical protein
MIKTSTDITKTFAGLTPNHLADPVEFARYFLDQIKSLPGRKIGFIGQPQSGTTLAIHSFTECENYQKLGKITTIYDPRGIPDTFNTTLPYFADLDATITAACPDWMAIIKQSPDNPMACLDLDNCVCPEPSPDLSVQMVNKISTDVQASRRMLLWKAALNLFCLRDLLFINGNQDPDCVIIFDLPYLPVAYNQYFEKLILLKRRQDWFQDPLFLSHIQTEGVISQAEQQLVAVRDQEIADCQSLGDWNFDHQILNDGDQSALISKLNDMISIVTL